MQYRYRNATDESFGAARGRLWVEDAHNYAIQLPPANTRWVPPEWRDGA